MSVSAWKREFRFRLVLLLGSLAVASLLAETFLRVINYQPKGRVVLAAITQYDPLLGWRSKPNVSTRIATKEYQTDLVYGPIGVRGPQRPYAKPPGVFRIVVLGDSFIDGFTVQLKDRVTEILEANLGPGVEVINLGVSAYSTDQELLVLEKEGWKYEPDLVVLALYYNDIWMNRERLLSSVTQKPRFILAADGSLVLDNVPVPKPRATLENRLKVYALIRSAVKSRSWLYSLASFGRGHSATPQPALPMPAGAGGTADQFKVYQTAETPELAKAWAITQALLRKMNRETREHGSRLVVFYVPTRVELSASEWNNSGIPPEYDAGEVARRLVRIGKEEDIPLIEPSSAFRERARDLYYHSDVHWNAAGNHLAAKLLAEYIREAWPGTGSVEPNEAQAARPEQSP